VAVASVIQIKLLANTGVLNADNALIMESLGVADTKDIVDMFFNVLVEKQDLQIAVPKPSPSKASAVQTTKRDQPSPQAPGTTAGKEYLQQTSFAANAALWAFATPSGFCPVWIETEYSKAVSQGHTYLAPKLKRTTNGAKRSIHVYFDHLHCITQDHIVAELLQLFKARLLPMSMAAPLGEKERAAAFSEEAVAIVA
jgi:hypothetical protein